MGLYAHKVASVLTQRSLPSILVENGPFHYRVQRGFMQGRVTWFGKAPARLHAISTMGILGKVTATHINWAFTAF